MTLSSCCNAPVKYSSHVTAESGGEFTSGFTCSACSKPCEVEQGKVHCKTSPLCSHNTNGRDIDKPCSIEYKPTVNASAVEEVTKKFEPKDKELFEILKSVQSHGGGDSYDAISAYKYIVARYTHSDSTLREEIKKKDELLDAHAVFVSEVLDGVKPERAWNELGKKIDVIITKQLEK